MGQATAILNKGKKEGRGGVLGIISNLRAPGFASCFLRITNNRFVMVGGGGGNIVILYRCFSVRKIHPHNKIE